MSQDYYYSSVTVLSAGYDNGSVVLYCVENGEKLHETKVGSHEVCSIVWNEDQSNKGGNYVANKYVNYILYHFMNTMAF